MASDRWSYDPRAHRYRDGNSGRFVPKSTILRLRDDALTKLGDRAADIGRRAASGAIDAARFRAEMRQAIKLSHVIQASFGRGGVNSMTAADWGRVGNTVRQQYAYLDGFVGAIERGELSAAQAAARARMYADAAVKSFEQAKAAAWGIQLPAHPADGGTPCLSHCRCRWEIKETANAIECTWRTSAGEVCSGCVARADRWSPLVLPRPYAPPVPEPVRLTAVRRTA